MLSFEPGLAIWTLITFVILLVILGKTAWPKILSALEERENKIRTSLEDAEKAREAAERATEDYNALIAKSKTESAEIIRQSRDQAEKVREDLIAQAKEEAANLVEKTKKELDQEREKAIQEMKKKAVDLSMVIATKIIESSLTKEKQLELARQALQEMEMN